MNKRNILILFLVVLVASLVLVTMVIAADLHPSHIGSMCPSGGEGTWHFVNNQTEGAYAGVLTVTFDDGHTHSVLPSHVNNKTQHFYIDHSGTLLSASTNLPGKLVLSDLDCVEPTATPTPEKPTATPTPEKPTATPTPAKPTPTPITKP